jgi:eukaryotic-like serine/threonine-protein kinase
MGEEPVKPRPDPETDKTRDVKSKETNEEQGERPNPGIEETFAGATRSAGGNETTLEGGPRTASGAGLGARSIGPYTLLRILGEGGMGQVWLAEQTSPVKRRVALKLIKGGMYDNRVMQRFDAERQSLAVMNHPTIAKIFDAGATPDGQPYFVMEYVDGPAITRYCDNKRLKIRERLELFIKVCEGVQHAHQKAIIHRDLKPSNVLVEEVDGKPAPRIIDFGIAKAILAEGEEDRAQMTRVGALIGTPGFISPEQADPGSQDVDTRADVYSLGVILYVLLTGCLPFDDKEWTNRPIDEVLRQLRQEDPPSPSAKLRDDRKTATESAEKRSSDQQQLVRQLRGDLDWITMKAVEKDRTRRYGTPTELAADIERYLTNQPVTARRANAGYRLQKYVRRHRLGVAVAVGAAALLVAFAAMQAVELRRIRRERDRANRIAEFMSNMFRVADPSEAKGNTVTAREILDKAAANIDKGLTQDPEVRTQLMDLMGTVYQSLGLYTQSQKLLERAVEVQKQALGPEKEETLKSESDLAWTLDHEGKYAEAEKMDREVLTVEKRTLGATDRQTIRTMNNLGWTLHREGHEVEAETVAQEAVAEARKAFGERNSLTTAALSNLAVIYSSEEKYGEAEKLQREMLEAERSLYGDDQPDTLQAMDNLASTLSHEKKYADAEKLERETLAAERRVLGPDHPFTAETIDNLAYTLLRDGHYAEAEAMQRESLEIEKRVLGPEHPDTLLTMLNIAVTLNAEGKVQEGDKVARETLAIAQRVLGPVHPLTLNTMQYFVQENAQLHNYGEVEKDQREILAVEEKNFGAEDPRSLSEMQAIAFTLANEKRFEDAQKMLEAVREIQRKKLGADSAQTAGTTYNMACIAARAGKKEQALAYLREAMDHGLGADVAGEMEKDTDLAGLHGDARFAGIVEEGKRRGKEITK